MPAFKAPRLTRRRTLAAAIAAGVAGSFLVAAAPTPASAEVINCNPPHTSSWVTIYLDSSEFLGEGGLPACVGFVGSNPFPPVPQEIICAGNNSGTVTYIDMDTGIQATHTFWPGGVYYVLNGTYKEGFIGSEPDQIQIENVTITGYSGIANCPQ